MFVLQQDFAQRGQFFLAVSGAGGVARRVENQVSGFWSDGFFQLCRSDLEAGVFIGHDEYWRAAGKDNLVGVGDPVGTGDDNFVPFLDECLGDVVQGVLCTAGNGNLLTSVLQVVIPLHLGDDGVFQVVGSTYRHVTGETGIYGFFPCLAYIRRGIEIRFSCAETDNVDSLCFERFSFGIYRQCG